MRLPRRKLQQKTIDDYFEKFKVRDAKMKALCSDPVSFAESVAGTASAGMTADEYYKQWRLAQIGRGQRYEAMRDKLAERATKANETAIAYVNDATPSIYSLNRNYAAYTIEQVAGNVDFTLFDESTVRRLLKESPDVMPSYPEARAVARGIDLAYGKQQITANVTSGILQGKSIPDMANDLQTRITDMNKTSAVRAARTAVTSAQNAGRQDSILAAEAMGINVMKEWMATRDERTRAWHGEADGQRVKPKESFKVGGEKMRYPADPWGSGWNTYNCRCTMVSYFPDYPDDKPRQTYSEWMSEKLLPNDESESTWIKTGEIAPYDTSYSYWKGEEMLIEDENGNLIRNPSAYDEAKRFDATIAQLDNKYNLKSDKMRIGTYDEVQPYLTDKQRERAKIFGDGAQAQAWYNYKTNETIIGFRPYGTTNSFAKDLNIRAKKIKNGEILQTVFENSPEGTAIHEFGHAYTDWLELGDFFEDENVQEYYKWYKSLSKDDIINGLSRYAATNRGEFAAECFAELQTSDPRPIAKKYGEFLVKAVDKSYNTTGTATDNYTVQKVLGQKIVQLPKKEYAHVMSELETWMTEEERQQVIVSKTIGNFSYTFVNDGTSYKCIRKKRIINLE